MASTSIYRGDINHLYIQKLEVERDIYQLEVHEATLIKNDLFYLDKGGKYISFRYNSYVRSREEAEDYLLESNNRDVLFVDYEKLKFEKIADKSIVKQLKKTYMESFRKENEEDKSR